MKPKTLKIRAGCAGGGKGALIQEDKSATLGCSNDQTLFVPTPFVKGARPRSAEDPQTWKNGEVANTLNTFDLGETRCNELAVMPCAYSVENHPHDSRVDIREDEKYIVRRLTPTENARLQGFPDWWCADLNTSDPTEDDIAFWSEVFETHRKVVNPDGKPKTKKQIVKWLQHPHTDSAEYKMWGNGVALPNVYYVMCAIKEIAENEERSDED